MYLKERTTQLILQRYNAVQEAKINQFNTAQNPNRRAKTATKDRYERIFRIVSRYDGLNLLAYMRRIGHLYQIPMIVNIVCEFQ